MARKPRRKQANFKMRVDLIERLKVEAARTGRWPVHVLEERLEESYARTPERRPVTTTLPA